MQTIPLDPVFQRMPDRIKPALQLLLEALEYAEQTSGKSWEFAVEIEQLNSLGLRTNDFRWLVRNQLVAHQREVTVEGDNGRAFRATGDLTFTNRTCFVLSDMGITVARQLLRHPFETPNCCRGTSAVMSQAVSSMVRQDLTPYSSRETMPITIPKWDFTRRLLTVNGACVKRFKWAAENQEAILNVFEEEGWPARIDDPLQPTSETDPKRRLSDTIKCLNRKQECPIIHFRGDGTGEGILWEFVELKDAPLPHFRYDIS